MNRFKVLFAFVIAAGGMCGVRAEETKRPDTQTNNKPVNTVGQMRPANGSTSVLIPRLLTHPVLQDLTVKGKQLPKNNAAGEGILLPHSNNPQSKYSDKNVGDFNAGLDNGKWLNKIEDSKEPGQKPIGKQINKTSSKQKAQ